MALAALSAALGEVPNNSHAHTYTIFGLVDKSPYLTRTLLPRLGAHRPVIHRIWRPDADEHMHNHPWAHASFLIVSGGYVEERLGSPVPVRTTYHPGDVNHLTKDTFHRIVDVEPNTWTLGLLGPREQSWGFLVNGKTVPFREYFALHGHVSEEGASQS